MKRLQRQLRRWFFLHVVTPTIIAMVASGIALYVVWHASRDISGSDKTMQEAGLLALIVAVLLSVLLLAVSWFRSARYVFSLREDSTEVGMWLMRTAFGKLPDEDPVVHKFPWVRGQVTSHSPAIELVNNWMEHWRSEVKAQSARLAEDVSRDMVLATEFQQALLNRPYPEVPAVHIEGRLRLEFHHRYNPALAIGGDFFDIMPIGNDCAGIFIADVMGHGVRSALITAILRALLSESQSQARNAAHFLKEINREFAEILTAMPTPIFASAFYLVADTTSRIATYACAGHPPPFQIHRDRARVSRLTNPQPKGAALGLLMQENYTGETVRLLDGNSFIFFTDGVYECSDPDGEEYGLARMEKVIQANIYKTTPEILDALTHSINTFVRGEPLADDLCLVAVDVTTTPRPVV
jgi:serine phosphatase RsbU (regulator of sigma subunit)